MNHGLSHVVLFIHDTPAYILCLVFHPPLANPLHSKSRFSLDSWNFGVVYGRKLRLMDFAYMRRGFSCVFEIRTNVLILF